MLTTCRHTTRASTLAVAARRRSRRVVTEDVFATLFDDALQYRRQVVAVGRRRRFSDVGVTQSLTLLTNVVARNRKFRLRSGFPVFFHRNLFRDFRSGYFWFRRHRWRRWRWWRRSDVRHRETSDKRRRSTRFIFIVDVNVVVEVEAAPSKSRGSTEQRAPVFRKRCPIQDVQNLGAARPRPRFPVPTPNYQVP